MRIPFNKFPQYGNEYDFLRQALRSESLAGDGEFSIACKKWFEERLPCLKALLTPSCTSALEMSALLLDLKEGDEVILPSFTFVSTANAFALRGAKIAFVDIKPDTMNIDESMIEAAITKRTKAIVPVHYAGVSCEMNEILNIAKAHNVYVIEDAAQGIMSEYDGKALGTLGHLGAYSFHATKNITSGGEGGLLIVNESSFKNDAEIIREKGTNRSLFFRGMVDKYTWVNVGGSHLPSELQAAYLWGQLQYSLEITEARLVIWNFYYENLKELSLKYEFDLPFIPQNCKHNAHMFYLKVRSLDERTRLMNYLKECGIGTAFHYVPLHSSPAGRKYGTFIGEDYYTTTLSERLLRLPLFYGMTLSDACEVVSRIEEFYS